MGIVRAMGGHVVQYILLVHQIQYLILLEQWEYIFQRKKVLGKRGLCVCTSQHTILVSLGISTTRQTAEIAHPHVTQQSIRTHLQAVRHTNASSRSLSDLSRVLRRLKTNL